ncbi:MAG: D-inositol-3-phosphate glycosyltransferase, partial [Chlamydiae bacterium]|nr:D-inositol-3-phosphate glycosyltransferase [Chlamydiota bacterium]
MKILITNTGPWGTGSFTVTQAISKELEALGHTVKIFFPDARLPSQDLDYFYSNQEKFIIWKFPLEKGGVRLEDFPLMIPDPNPRVKKARTFKELSQEELALYFGSAKEELTKVLNDFQPDIVECQHIWALNKAIEELNYPFICTAHHSDQMGFEYDHRMQKFALDGAHNASYIFAISEFVKNEVIRLYNVPPEKVVTLGNSYDKTVFRPQDVNKKAVLKQFNITIPDDATIISFAGKISKTKGIDILLEANKILCPAKKVHFLIFGAGDLDQTLKPKIDEKYCFE